MSGKNGHILQPGVMTLERDYMPGQVGASVAAFPVPSGVKMVEIGGMHPFVFMCACIAAGGDKKHPDDIIAAADSLFTKALEHVANKAKKAQQAQSAPQPVLATE